MAAAQAGDQIAYARLLRDVLPLLRMLVRRTNVPPAHVEDVVQDVLMAVHRVRHTYDPSLPFVPWLAAIARRRSIDVLRREGRRGAWETSAPETLETFADPTANNETETKELRQWLAQAVVKLPPRQRRALELVKLQEMTVAEAAQASGQTEGAVKVNVHRAIRALRALLGEGDTR
jgi:RNA polymerase sigma-70 factor (ECF subfamily)